MKHLLQFCMLTTRERHTVNKKTNHVMQDRSRDVLVIAILDFLMPKNRTLHARVHSALSLPLFAIFTLHYLSVWIEHLNGTMALAGDTHHTLPTGTAVICCVVSQV